MDRQPVVSRRLLLGLVLFGPRPRRRPRCSTAKRPFPSPSATTEAAATHATPTAVDQMAMPITRAATTRVRRGTLVKTGRTVPYR